jgi:hypothetical protein
MMGAWTLARRLAIMRLVGDSRARWKLSFDVDSLRKKIEAMGKQEQ